MDDLRVHERAAEAISWVFTQGVCANLLLFVTKWKKRYLILAAAQVPLAFTFEARRKYFANAIKEKEENLDDLTKNVYASAKDAYN